MLLQFSPSIACPVLPEIKHVTDTLLSRKYITINHHHKSVYLSLILNLTASESWATKMNYLLNLYIFMYYIKTD